MRPEGGRGRLTEGLVVGGQEVRGRDPGDLVGVGPELEAGTGEVHPRGLG